MSHQEHLVTMGSNPTEPEEERVRQRTARIRRPLAVVSGKGGVGKSISVETGAPLRGRIPIDPRVAACRDAGGCLAHPDSAAAPSYCSLAARLREREELRCGDGAAMIKRLRVTVLADNSVAALELVAEHGLSMLIEADDRRILFDTGQGKVLRANAEAMGISLSPLDAVVLSHGHYDHTGGLAGFLQEVSPSAIFLHPAAMQQKYAKKENPPHCPSGSRTSTRRSRPRWTSGPRRSSG